MSLSFKLNNHQNHVDGKGVNDNHIICKVMYMCMKWKFNLFCTHVICYKYYNV